MRPKDGMFRGSARRCCRRTRAGRSARGRSTCTICARYTGQIRRSWATKAGASAAGRMPRSRALPRRPALRWRPSRRPRPGGHGRECGRPRRSSSWPWSRRHLPRPRRQRRCRASAATPRALRLGMLRPGVLRPGVLWPGFLRLGVLRPHDATQPRRVPPSPATSTAMTSTATTSSAMTSTATTRCAGCCSR